MLCFMKDIKQRTDQTGIVSTYDSDVNGRLYIEMIFSLKIVVFN